MRIALGADKVTLLEFTRASLRLLFVIPGFYSILDIWEFITGVRLTIATHRNKGKSRSRVSVGDITVVACGMRRFHGLSRVVSVFFLISL